MEARRGFSRTTSRLQRGPLRVTKEPPPPGSGDTVTPVVWGLAERERVSLRLGGTAVGESARLDTGPVGVGMELTLEIGLEGAANSWRVPVRVMVPASPAPDPPAGSPVTGAPRRGGALARPLQERLSRIHHQALATAVSAPISRPAQPLRPGLQPQQLWCGP